MIGHGIERGGAGLGDPHDLEVESLVGRTSTEERSFVRDAEHVLDRLAFRCP